MNLMSSLHTVLCRQNADLRRLKIILKQFSTEEKIGDRQQLYTSTVARHAYKRRQLGRIKKLQRLPST